MADEKLDTEIRREQIAEAALELVATQGVSRLSVAAVARRVGLVPSGIYRHFKSKDEILAAVLDLLETRMMINLQSAEAETDDPLERLKSLLFRHVRFIREGRVFAFPQIIFSDAVHRGHPDRKSRVHRILNRYLEGIAKFVREGQARGTVRPEVDPGTAALMFFGIVVPGGILWHLTEGGFDVTRHAQQAWQLFCAAIGKEAG
jgi:AcrR family transcriptional regulator